MSLLKDEISIGDHVEVKVFRPPPVKLVPVEEKIPSRYTPVEEWLPATVSSIWREGIGVTFSDHEKLAIPNHLILHGVRRPMNARS